MPNNQSVLVSGRFNVLHSGHLRLLRFAKESGYKLIVAVESDRLAGKHAHVPQDLRLEGIQSVTWVDEALIYDESINLLIKRIRPDIVVKGKEHEHADNPEAKELEVYGGQLKFSSGEAIFSSRDLIRKEFDFFDPKSIELPIAYLSRHAINITQLLILIQKFKNLKICVIGDLIIDEYITCEPLGMSQEDPTIVVTPLDYSRFVGGAGIVAAHAAGLGAKVHFISVTGDDTSRKFALEELIKSGVNANLFIDKGRPTTLKQRYRSKGKSLLRVSHLHQTAISEELQNKIICQIEKYITELDLIVLSDFNYGCLPQKLVDKIIEQTKSKGILIAADSQSSSQVGDISRFKGMNLITPTEREARISTRNREDGLVVLAEQLREISNAENILLKLGGEGLLIHAGSENNCAWVTDRVEALNSSPKDVAGAGDSLLIASAMTLASGGNIWEAACLGSIAAAVQVGRIGNIPLKTEELYQELR